MGLMGERFNPAAADIATIMFIWSMCQQLIPNFIKSFVDRLFDRMSAYFYPYMEITFHEYPQVFKRSDAYVAIQTYLGSKSTQQAHRLKAEIVKKTQSLSLSMDEFQAVFDYYNGVKVKWVASKYVTDKKSISLYPSNDEKRFYLLTFHRRDRKIVTEEYLKFVIQEGKAIEVRNRQRKLFTNNPSDNWWDYKKYLWSHVVFEHPATFQTLAMDPKKKEDIINDLITFSQSKDYYAKMGKAWKRGYLLYGPPGTGKSTMIAAMANLLNYDIYDLELTAVNDNTELRRLLIDTPSKSIIVIEDIDCSLDLTAERKKSKKKEAPEIDPIAKKGKEESENEGSKVTLSGLLNFVDGLWSSSVGERIIVFTTNHIERLDPALIRRGRMDKHIELSYCKFEAFKVLAQNYLNIDSHPLFDKVWDLLEEVDMTPADVAENLMCKSAAEGADTCLEALIQALESGKKAKKEEEAKSKTVKKEVKKGALRSSPNLSKKKSPQPKSLKQTWINTLSSYKFLVTSRMVNSIV